MTEQRFAKKAHEAATGDDVRHILGDIRDDSLFEILALRPTIVDLEEAALRLTGDGDRLARAGRPLGDIAAEIVALLGEEEEDEPRSIH